jgi:hypothetical protein
LSPCPSGAQSTAPGAGPAGVGRKYGASLQELHRGEGCRCSARSPRTARFWAAPGPGRRWDWMRVALHAAIGTAPGCKRQVLESLLAGAEAVGVDGLTSAESRAYCRRVACASRLVIPVRFSAKSLRLGECHTRTIARWPRTGPACTSAIFCSHERCENGARRATGEFDDGNLRGRR